MFLQKGGIPKELYPGNGGEQIGTIDPGRRVDNLYVVMNGFDIQYEDGDNHIKCMQMDLGVRQTNGNSTAELHCNFKLNNENASGDSFWAACDDVLIGYEHSLATQPG